MTNGGFLEAKRSNPLGLTLVVVGHAAALTAIALAPPETFQKITYVKTIVDSIKDEAPPPPPPPMPEPKAQPRSQPNDIEPLVDIGQKTGPIIALDPGPVRPFDPPVQPPAIPEPVLVEAKIDPAAAGRFQPDYPSELVRAEIEGTVTVRVLIGVDGRVKAVEMVKATNEGFFEPTQKQALRYWRFRPATRDGVAVESWRTMTVRFALQN